MTIATEVSNKGVVSRWLRRAGGTLKSGLAVVGFATVVGAYFEYKRLYPIEAAADDDDKKKKKKRVLVVPFHRMKIVERKEGGFRRTLEGLEGTDDGGGDGPPMQVELKELVELLHQAASDPSISAVYGIFGHGGMGVSQAGWAQLEEVRNALKVIKESHRRHAEPNLSYETQTVPRVPRKPLYAYTDTFSSMTDPSNKEYYLASIFTHVHLQEKGELNMFGMLSQQFFIRDFLEKYGIQVHVFKHGNYKNSPNIFTHTNYNKFHRENVANIHNSINEGVCDDITNSRSKALLTSWLTKKHKGKSVDNAELWKRIYESGTFPAQSAWKAGLVDYLPHRNPLTDLVDSSDDDEKDKDEKDKISAKWKPQETMFEKFKADKAVHLKDYAKAISKKKYALERREKWKEFLSGDSTFKKLTGMIGMSGPSEGDSKSKERIALLNVTGMIGDESARKLVGAIKKIGKDDSTKCVVVRVSSPGGIIHACETIKQELQALDLPVVVSFGDVSASGGYYISSAADRIFSSPKTITGSIGVFGVRMDLTGLGAQYGVTVDHVATGDLSATYSPFHPMSNKMKTNVADSIDRYYDQFKTIVSEGRTIPMERLESIAQGRVWTGEQAKSIGLVDELGGLHRALAYARRSYTSNVTTDNSDVIVWPKKRTLFERLKEAREKADANALFAALYGMLTGLDVLDEGSFESGISKPASGTTMSLIDSLLHSPTGTIPGTLSGALLTADENSAVRCLLENAKDHQQNVFPGFFWE